MAFRSMSRRYIYVSIVGTFTEALYHYLTLFVDDFVTTESG